MESEMKRQEIEKVLRSVNSLESMRSLADTKLNMSTNMPILYPEAVQILESRGYKIVNHYDKKYVEAKKGSAIFEIWYEKEENE